MRPHQCRPTVTVAAAGVPDADDAGVAGVAGADDDHRRCRSKAHFGCYA